MELKTRRINEAQFDLVANIRFGKHRIPINNGEAVFGLRKGKLKVLLTNGKVPLENIKLNGEFQTEVEITVKEGKETGGQIDGKLGGKSQGIGGSVKSASKQEKELSYKDYQVSTEGDLQDPTWVFEVKTNKEILEGLLKSADLAEVQVNAKPFSLTATFEVENNQDIHLVNGSLLWQTNITKKKIAILERSIVNRWLKEILNEKAYLSLQELTHG